MAPAVKPLSARKMDYFYFLFFTHVIPIIIFVDMIPYYPTSIVPRPLANLSSFYLTTFKDPLVLSKPLWFLFFSASELTVQLPIALWMVTGPLQNDDAMVPFWGFVYAGLTWSSTAACLVEFIVGWGVIVTKAGVDRGADGLGLTVEEKVKLIGVYAPYFITFTIMMIDFGNRIRLGLAENASRRGVRKAQ